MCPYFSCQRSAIHYAGIGVRQQTCALQHHFGHRRGIVERARKALPLQKFTRLREDAFGLVAQAEQRFLASGVAGSLSQGKHFLWRHEMRARLTWIFAERAVAAVIAAKRGQGNENFLGEGDRRSLAACTKLRSRRQEARKRGFQA